MFEDKSDTDLVYSLKEDKHTQDCLYELISRHSGIFYDMVNHYTVCYKNSYHREEMLEDIEFLFYKACLRYEKDKGAKFSTFLGNETKWHCLNFYNKNKKYTNNYYEDVTSLDRNQISKLYQENPDTQTPEEIELSPKIVEKIFVILERHPDRRVLEIFKLRYLDPLDKNSDKENFKTKNRLNKLTPWKVVGKKLNLSIQGCINIHNQALPYIRKNLKKV
jgi:DNA-directed RNA polymerase specialized sigma subunit